MRDALPLPPRDSSRDDNFRSVCPLVLLIRALLRASDNASCLSQLGIGSASRAGSVLHNGVLPVKLMAHLSPVAWGWPSFSCRTPPPGVGDVADDCLSAGIDMHVFNDDLLPTAAPHVR